MSEIISKTEKVKQIFDLVKEIEQAKTETVKGFLIIGRNLDTIQKEKLYGYYGSHIENFEMFLKEIGIKHGTAFNCIRIWRAFGAYKNLYALPDYFRLVMLLPLAEKLNEEEKEEWITKAKELTFSDFRDEIRIARGKISELDCKHDGEKDFFFRCKICGKFVKVSENELRELLNKK
jgi:hypothetical protein